MYGMIRKIMVMLGAVWIAGLSLEAKNIVIVENGRAKARIYLPKVFGRATMLAAEELSKYIKKISGAELPIDYGKRAPRFNASAIILKTKIDPAKEISADGTEDVFSIVKKGSEVLISGNSDTATLYGAYKFLNDLGVEWFMPGEIGEYVPKRATISLAPGIKTYHPPFRSRQLDLSGSPKTHFAEKDYDTLIPEYGMWILRNRCQFSRTIHRGRRPSFNNSRENTRHCLSAILRGVDIKKHSERFPLVTKNGVRKRRTRGAQICFSNKENVQAAVEMGLKQFAKDPNMLTCSMSLADHGGMCECDDCVKENGGLFPPLNPNLLVWKFMNRVIRGIREEMPNKRIAFYSSYGSLTCPPEGFKAADGIVGITANVSCNNKLIDDPKNLYAKSYMRNILATKKAGTELGAREYTMFAGTPQPLALLEQVRIYRDLGYVYYHCESMGRDQRNFVIQWVQARLMNNPDSNPQELLEYFCSKFYGKAGKDVLQLMYLIDERFSKLPRVVFGSQGTMQWIMSDDLIKKGRAILRSTAKKVFSLEAKRLDMFDKTFEMYSRNALFVRAGYAYMNNGKRDEANLRNALSKFKDFDDYWRTNDLSATCSPNIIEKARRFVKVLENTPRQIKPTPRKGYESPDAAKKLAALFNLNDIPKKINDLFYLPSVWRFKADIKRKAKERRWFDPGFDDSDWTPLSVFNFYERQGFDSYDGGYCYRVNFKAPAFPTGKKVFLRIGSLDDEGDVYMNGKLVYRRFHLKAQDWKRSFEIEVTNAIKPGKENNVTIVGNDEYGMGGLWNPCALYTR